MVRYGETQDPARLVAGHFWQSHSDRSFRRDRGRSRPSKERRFPYSPSIDVTKEDKNGMDNCTDRVRWRIAAIYALTRAREMIEEFRHSYCPSELLRLGRPSSLLGSLQSLDRRVAASAQRRVDPFDHEVMNLDPLLEGDLA